MTGLRSCGSNAASEAETLVFSPPLETGVLSCLENTFQVSPMLAKPSYTAVVIIGVSISSVPLAVFCVRVLSLFAGM